MLKLMENAFANEKIEITHFTTPPRQNSLPGPYHHSQPERNLSFPQKKKEEYGNLFQNVLLKISFFKNLNRRLHFYFKGPFGDFEQKA